MSTQTDLIKLYSSQILALAADIPFTTRLVTPDASAKKRSPLCGSTVEVDLSLVDGQIAAFGQDVKACALGQAAASVIAQNIIGRRTEEIRIARDQLKTMLKSDGPVPSAPFDGLRVLEPARDYKNRHASILLSFDAILEALNQLENTQQAETS